MLPWTSDHIHRNYISNYFIGDDCFIQNVNVMYVEGRSSFGNNVEVSVLNETGGREVPIYIHMRFQNSEAFQCNGCLYSDLYGNRRIEDSSCILRGEPHEIC